MWVDAKEAGLLAELGLQAHLDRVRVGWGWRLVAAWTAPSARGPAGGW